MSSTEAKQAQVADRRAKAISMRIAGANWQGIADTLGYKTRGAACQDVTRALEANRREEAAEVDQLRHLAGQRFDRLQAAFWGKALKGDTKAADVVLKVMAQRAKLDGTDAPTRINVDAQQLGDEILAMLADGDANRGDDHETAP